MGAHAFIEVIQAMQHVAISNSSCSKHAVITLNQIIQGQHLIHIGNAHLQTTLYLSIILGAQTSLHIATQAFNSNSAQNALGSPTLTNVHMHAAAFDAALYDGVNIAVGNQGNTSTGLANLLHQRIMTFTIQEHNIQICNLAAHSFSNTLQIYTHGSININAALSARTYSNFIHIHIGSMQQAAAGSNSNYSNSTRLSFSY